MAISEVLPESDSRRDRDISRALRSTELYRRHIQESSRRIEECWWFRPVRIDFDLPDGEPADAEMRSFTNELAAQLVDQGHPAPGRPTQYSDMIIGLLDIPRGEAPLSQRMAEIPARIMEASSRYGINAFQKNYTLVTNIAEDLTQLPKREMEFQVRAVMSRAGALKILFQTPDKIALATMEGGLGHEFRDNPQMVKNMRDRLVTFACARASGSFQVVENAIDREE